MRLAFSDPEIIKLATEDFVPVTGDDWYQRRRQDAEGEFFRKVADQGPRKGRVAGHARASTASPLPASSSPTKRRRTPT